MQIIINLLLKFIVYIYDEIHTTIPFYLQIFINSVINIIKGIYKKNDSQLKLNLWLILNMEKKTKKYLHIFEIDEECEIPDKIFNRNSI